MISFFKRVHRLSFIDRCNQTPHIKLYPVAVHSYYITLYAMLFADLENDRIRREFAASSIAEEFLRMDELRALEYDTSEVIKRALVHDLEESETGDIIFTLHDENSEFKKVLDEIRKKCVEEKVFSELPSEVRKYYIRLWQQAKDNTKEGRLVAAMDKFEILIFAMHELDLGNQLFLPLYRNSLDILEHKFDIPSLTEVLKEIRLQYDRFLYGAGE